MVQFTFIIFLLYKTSLEKPQKGICGVPQGSALDLLFLLYTILNTKNWLFIVSWCESDWIARIYLLLFCLLKVWLLWLFVIENHQAFRELKKNLWCCFTRVYHFFYFLLSAIFNTKKYLYYCQLMCNWLLFKMESRKDLFRAYWLLFCFLRNNLWCSKGFYYRPLLLIFAVCYLEQSSVDVIMKNCKDLFRAYFCVSLRFDYCDCS